MEHLRVEHPPGFRPVSAGDRERREDQAYALRLAGVSYDEIAEQLGFPNKGVAHRWVERAMRRHLPDPRAAAAVAEIDARILRLFEQRRLSNDPGDTLAMRNLMHERLALLAPTMVDAPLPQVDVGGRERERELHNVLLRIRREEAKLVASIPKPSPEELAEIAADMGWTMRGGLPRPPRRPGRRRR